MPQGVAGSFEGATGRGHRPGTVFKLLHQKLLTLLLPMQSLKKSRNQYFPPSCSSLGLVSLRTQDPNTLHIPPAPPGLYPTLVALILYLPAHSLWTFSNLPLGCSTEVMIRRHNRMAHSDRTTYPHTDNLSWSLGTTVSHTQPQGMAAGSRPTTWLFCSIHLLLLPPSTNATSESWNFLVSNDVITFTQISKPDPQVSVPTPHLAPHAEIPAISCSLGAR